VAINAIIEWFEENSPQTGEYYQEPENEQEILND